MNTKPYISKLSASGLKGGDFAHDLGRVTVFKGRSKSGKTSRLNALRLALTGADPTVGRLGAKTGAAIMDLASKSTLDVMVRTNEGQSRTCRWTRKGKSVTTHPVEGDLPEAPAILINPEEYFGLSDAKKIEYVFGLCPMEDSDEFGGAAIVARIKNLTLEENNEHTVEKVRALAAEIDERDTQRHDAGETIQAWLRDTIAELKERLKVAKATCDRMTKTVQGLTQIGQTEAPLNFAAEIAAKRKEMDGLREQIGVAQEQLRTFNRAVEKRDQIQRAAAKIQPVPVPDVSGAVAELNRQIAALTVPPPDPRLDELKQQRDTLEREAKAYESKTVMRMAQLNTARNDLGKFTELKAEREKGIAQLEVHLKSQLARPCCPECGTPTESMRDRVMKQYEANVQSLTELVGQYTECIRMASIEVEKAEKRLSEAQLADAGNELKRQSIAKIQSEINAAIERSAAAATARAEKERTIRQKLNELEASVRGAKDQNAEHDRAQKAMADSQAELERLGAQGNIETTLTAHQVELNRLTLELSTLEEQQRAFQRLKDDEQRNALALIEHAQAKADCDVLKAAIETLEDVQTRMVETAFWRLLRTVNRFTVGEVMESPVEYRDSELGYFRGSTWVSHRTFSGTEKAMTYAGLAAALAEGAPVLVVTLDELGVMDYTSLVAFLNRMVELTEAGEIGQFIGCWSNDGANDFSLPGVTSIIL